MAHELEIRDGEASMFYVQDPPWHRLGTKLAQPATAAEAISAAKLNWRVEKVPLFATRDEVSVPVPNTYGVVRTDRWGKPDCPILGIVGQEYTLLQNEDAFSFFDPIVGKDAAVYHTAGVLRNGQRIWISAKLPTHIVVRGEDIAEKYLLLSNSHDGESSVQVKFTPIRVVCQNTLTMALNQGRTIRVAHTRDMAERLKRARDLLGIVEKRFTDIGAMFQAMCRIQLDTDRLAGYLKAVFPDPQDPDDEPAILKVRRNRRWSEFFFANGQGNQVAGVRGTLWAAYNGVTEFIDHRRTQQTDDRRLDAMWFGDGYLTKVRAYKAAAALLGVSRN